MNMSSIKNDFKIFAIRCNSNIRNLLAINQTKSINIRLF